MSKHERKDNEKPIKGFERKAWNCYQRIIDAVKRRDLHQHDNFSEYVQARNVLNAVLTNGFLPDIEVLVASMALLDISKANDIDKDCLSEFNERVFEVWYEYATRIAEGKKVNLLALIRAAENFELAKMPFYILEVRHLGNKIGDKILKKALGIGSFAGGPDCIAVSETIPGSYAYWSDDNGETDFPEKDGETPLDPYDPDDKNRTLDSIVCIEGDTSFFTGTCSNWNDVINSLDTLMELSKKEENQP